MLLESLSELSNDGSITTVLHYQCRPRVGNDVMLTSEETCMPWLHAHHIEPGRIQETSADKGMMSTQTRMLSWCDLSRMNV